MPDRLEAMRAFVAVCEERGFSAAARRTGLSSSAVTRLVSGLEADLGVQLLLRSTRSMRLTEAGEAYLPMARLALAGVADAEAAARGASSAPGGVLRVSAPLVFGRLFLGRITSAFLERYPAARVEILLSNDNARLIDERVDVAIRVGKLPDSGLRARTILRTRQAVVASPSYLARHGTPSRPADLGGHRLIGFIGLAPRRRWTFGLGAKSTSIDVEPCLFSDNAEAAIGAAVAGVGILNALGYQVAGDLAEGRLIEVLGDCPKPEIPIQTLMPQARHDEPLASAFAATIAAELRRPTPPLAATARSSCP